MNSVKMSTTNNKDDEMCLESEKEQPETITQLTDHQQTLTSTTTTGDLQSDQKDIQSSDTPPNQKDDQTAGVTMEE